MAKQITAKGAKVYLSGLFFFLLLSARSSWQQTPSAGPAYLVKDINTLPRSDAFPIEYGEYGRFGDRYLIWITDSEHGQEPWITDGTPEGTYLLCDIYPGPASSWPGWGFGGRRFYASNGWAIFSARDEEHGVEPWRTDGTPEGTFLLKDIREGITLPEADTNSSDPSCYFSARMTIDGEEKDLVLFNAFSHVYGRELFITDGTSAGTQLLMDIYPGVDSSGWPQSSSPIPNFQYDGEVYFQAGSSYLMTKGLWRTDGTEQGTCLIKSVSWNGYAGYPWEFGGAVYFSNREDWNSPQRQWKINQQTGTPEIVEPAWCHGGGWDFRGDLIYWWDDGVNGKELWKSDGTAAGTVMVKDIVPGKGSPSVQFLEIINDILYFRADDKIHGFELWKSDRTSEGTQLVVDLYPGPLGALTNFDEFLQLNGKLYLVAQKPGGYNDNLYVSDGTAAGTRVIWNGTINFELDDDPISRTLGKTSDAVYFGGLDNARGIELWMTDGTNPGTKLVSDVYRGEGSSFPMIIGGIGDTILCTAADAEHGRELWRSNGTPPGTFLVKDICIEGSYSANPVIFGGIDGGLIFTAWDKKHGQELWKSDGTEAGTTLLRDICPGPDSGAWPDYGPAQRSREVPPKDVYFWEQIDGFAPTTPFQQAESSSEGPCLLNGEILFTARGRNLQMELWKTNGIATTMVKDINTGRMGSRPLFKISFKNCVFFGSYTEEAGWELYKSDGTPSGTKIVKDINPGPGHSYPHYFVQLGEWLYFRADDGVHGFELWRTDGTKSGTELVCDLVPGPASGFGWQSSDSMYSYGPQPVAEGGLFYFGANVPSQGGYELWRSDGTAGGTFLIKDINPGSSGSGAWDFTGYNGKLIFSAYEAQHGYEMWITDGTGWGTTLVKDIWQGPSGALMTWLSSYGPRFVKSGDWVYFVPYAGYSAPGLDEFAGELWKTDGTELGTLPVKDIYPGRSTYNNGPYQSWPIQMTDIDGVLLFSADDGIRGRELWRSDGTEAGTYLIQDIYPGDSGWQEQFTRLGNLVFFVAYDRRGYELWAMPIEAVGAMTPAQPTGRQ